MPRRDLAHGLLGGLEEIEERVAGLQHISAGITTRWSHALNAFQHLELGTTGTNYARALHSASCGSGGAYFFPATYAKK